MKYNIKEIEIGTPVFIQATDHSSLRVTVSNHAKKTGKKFTCKKVNDGIEVTRLS